MSVTSMLNLTCRVRTKSHTQSTTTGMPVAALANLTGVRLALQAQSAWESVAQGAERGNRVFDAYFEHATAVTVGDTIDEIGPDAVWADRSMSIVSPPVDETGRGVYYRCEVIEVGGGAQR